MIGKFTKNTFITFLTQGLIFIISLGISVLLARILGPEKRGIYSLAMILPSFLLYFTCFGIGQSSVFYLGEKKYSPKEIFGTNLILVLLISIFAILIGLIITFFLNNTLFPGIEKKYLFSAIFLAPCLIFFSFIVSILLGLQNIKKYNLIYLFNKSLLLFALIGIFILGIKFEIINIIITEITVVFISCVVLFFVTKKEAGGICLKFNKEYFKNSFLYGLKIYLGSIISFLHNRIGILLINSFLNPLMVGFYSIGVGLSEKIYLISDSVATVLFPKVASENNKLKIKNFTPVIFRNILWIIIIINIIIFIIAKWLIIFLYSTSFSASIKPFQILLIGAIAISGSKILESDIRGRGKPMLITWITGISTVLNIILNIILIPKLGILGAAWSTSISLIINLIFTLFIYCKISGNLIKDMFFIKKFDLKLYQNLFIILKNKIKK